MPHPPDAPSLAAYDRGFFDQLQPGVLASARVVVPVIASMFVPKSVVDIGCGRGAWLLAFEQQGVRDILGVDGPHIDPADLLVEAGRFLSHDLSQPFTVERTFDLALCLEVAEHLPPRAAAPLVAELTRLAPVVVFSAAVPGQGGVGHVNEQWPSYWRSLFEGFSFVRLDPIRRQIWQDQRVSSCYRQNMYVFASADLVAASAQLTAEERLDREPELELITTAILDQLLPPQSLRRLLRQLPGSVRASLEARFFSRQ
jgi:SAM-dependent methyltransferase